MSGLGYVALFAFAALGLAERTWAATPVVLTAGNAEVVVAEGVRILTPDYLLRDPYFGWDGKWPEKTCAGCDGCRFDVCADSDDRLGTEVAERPDRCRDGAPVVRGG